MDKMFDLTGRVALVTGISSMGIGHSSAKVFAEHGAKVFGVCRREQPLLEMKAEIEAIGGEFAYCVADVSQEDQVKASVDQCVEAFGRLDIMLLVAGTSGLPARGGTDRDAVFNTENWHNVEAVNLDSIMYYTKYGWAECAKNKVGSIIAIASIAALPGVGNDASAAYTATKGAIRSLTNWFAINFGKEGVRFNSIYPGFIRTSLTASACDYKPFIEPKLQKIPVGVWGEPEDIAYGALYLASDASKFVTGQHLVIDGGETC